MTKLKVGDKAPEFTCKDKDGKDVSLSQFSGIVVLYFYPKDDSSVCTKQACEFRDKYQKFIEAGANVIGVSQDSSASHSQFTSKYSLPFTLLTDKDGQLAKEYGVEKTALFLPGRTTYIIDKNHNIAHIHSSLLNASSHIEESLKIIEKLKNQ
ncbi:hypothetical protein DICPUDRAFT_25457 [Dictyostelium purpureum]|uniref:thioredoxin-dependent peroxiredoxin n=1 Tax=Dictyostelium purpureum TaxID=5786 RepID=F0Z6X9_DICPU|nr:uncharacterized protein DICPUDRAFT_25457 [Dictyostelium purpureum]EGC40232.1 hypothetical protein DICPUDRAFT_25457 [Dictyostelium purpureum]|eukprot:XP_003283168.1 hypothetical protein DICPUDRAFT_25457 [Dictyostelium purpureum]